MVAEVLLLYLSSKISGFRVAGGDSGVVPQQQVMHRCTNNLTAANHNCSFPCHRYTCREAASINVRKSLWHIP